MNAHCASLTDLLDSAERSLHMPDATINGQRTKPLPAATQAQMKRGVPQRQAIATTTKPRTQVKVG